MSPTAADIIHGLGLEPHPEGGHFRETHRSAAGPGERAAVTSIYFLLAAGERSRWHRIDTTEIWHYHAGAALRLDIAEADAAPTGHILGPDLSGGQRPQAVVPPGAWQAAESLGNWTLVGCTVAPGFQFEGFVMAPAGWEPGS